MLAALASVAAVTVLLTLAISSVEHASSVRGLASALRVHGLLPGGLVIPAAAGVLLAELMLAAAIGYAMLVGTGAGDIGPAASAACAVLFAVYTGYLLRILPTATTRFVPCGCGRGDEPVTTWVVGRAACLAGLALVAAPGWGSVVAPRESGSRFALAAVAGGAIAVLLWTLPTAMVVDRPPGRLPGPSANSDGGVPSGL